MKKTYSIKEIFYTLQGEGQHAGRPAVFCRFSGCNLWSGREEDRHKAICQFCDTDFWGTDGQNGGKYSAQDLVNECKSLWKGKTDKELYIVCTGGEPALQLDDELVNELKKAGFIIAVETNGTLELPNKVDWICLSPKAGTDIKLQHAHEVKIVYPQKGISPNEFATFNAEHFYVQPMEETNKTEENIASSIAYCLENPQWNLSLQTHKIVGID